MTITYSIDHAIGTTESVNVEQAAKSELTLIRTQVDPKTGDVTSQYVLSSGDSSYPATVTYRSQLNDRNGGGTRRISCTLSTWATADDSVSGNVKKSAISATFSVNVPQDVQVELADIDDLVGNCFSFLYPSVSAGARSTAYLSKLLFGVSQVA